jgi:hypothetical protein
MKILCFAKQIHRVAEGIILARRHLRPKPERRQNASTPATLFFEMASPLNTIEFYGTPPPSGVLALTLSLAIHATAAASRLSRCASPRRDRWDASIRYAQSNFDSMPNQISTARVVLVVFAIRCLPDTATHGCKSWPTSQ